MSRRLNNDVIYNCNGTELPVSSTPANGVTCASSPGSAGLYFPTPTTCNIAGFAGGGLMGVVNAVADLVNASVNGNPALIASAIMVTGNTSRPESGIFVAKTTQDYPIGNDCQPTSPATDGYFWNRITSF